MSDQGESEDALAVEPTVTAVFRPRPPEASAAGVACRRSVTAADGEPNGIGASPLSELGADRRRPVGGH